MKNKISGVIILSLFLGIFLMASVGAQTVPAAETNNAAEKINVALKIPLPFVPTNCFVEDEDGNPTATPAVCNLADYLKGVYRLLIGAGALFAVVMIIIAGYQWMLNGGSSGQVGDAKKRIWNASIGLVLALLSYVILNTISARLVALKLPEIKPVQPFFAGQGIFCATDPKIRELYEASSNRDNFFVEQVLENSQSVGINGTLCGKNYNTADKAATCKGNVCLTNGSPDPNKNCINSQCGSGVVYGNIDWTSGNKNNDKGNGYVDTIELIPVCSDGERMPAVGKFDTSGSATAYKIGSPIKKGYVYKVIDGKQQLVAVEQADYKFSDFRCSDRRGAGFKGFVLVVEVHNDCYDYTIAPDTVYALGKNNSQPIYQDHIYDPANIDWNKIDATSLLQMEDLESGLKYDLFINRSIFPVKQMIGHDSNCPIQ